MALEPWEQAKTARAGAQRARRLADGGLNVADRNRMLLYAQQLDEEALELERHIAPKPL